MGNDSKEIDGWNEILGIEIHNNQNVKLKWMCSIAEWRGQRKEYELENNRK